MNRCLFLTALGLLIAAAPAGAAVSGKYVEARTCDIWTAPCFANAEVNLTGKHGTMAWSVDKGTVDGVRLDGLSVVAVVAASDTLGLDQTGPGKAILIVDKKADASQREALIRFAKKQGGTLVGNVVSVQIAAIELTTCKCEDGSCSKLRIGKTGRIETRCLDSKHDKVCGNESALYPPMAKNVKANAAVAVEHSFTGKGFNETWKEANRRAAYVGSFESN